METLPTERQMETLLTERQIETLPTERRMETLLTERQIETLLTESQMETLLTERWIETLLRERQMKTLPTESWDGNTANRSLDITCFKTNVTLLPVFSFTFSESHMKMQFSAFSAMEHMSLHHMTIRFIAVK